VNVNDKVNDDTNVCARRALGAGQIHTLLA